MQTFAYEILFGVSIIFIIAFYIASQGFDIQSDDHLVE